MLRASLFFTCLSVIVWCVGDALLTPATVTMSGHVWASSCERLASLPGPTVSDEDGKLLASGTRVTLSPMGPPGCLGRFDVPGLPERDRYLVAVGSLSAPVPRGSVAAVELSER